MEFRYFFFIFFTISSFHLTNGYNILGIFPHIGKSHYWIFEPILKELAYRGHNVTIYSFFPPKESIKNFNFINFDESIEIKSTEILDLKERETFLGQPSTDVNFLMEISFEYCEKLLKNDNVHRLIYTNEKYDLVLYELFIHDCFLPIIGKINAPHIGLSSSNMLPWYYDDLGYSDNPNYNPNLFLNYGTKMSFTERIINSYYTILLKLKWSWFARPKLQAIASKHIPGPVPEITEVLRETSLVLINSHYTVSGARPMGPNFIEIAGIHLEKKEQLPKELKSWMDSCEDGVIYFSMGSMLRGSTLPETKRIAILEVFKGLKQQILWKWEENDMPGKSNNIRIEKWLPQRAVLAHPKTVLFITHCGMLSSVEAIDSGVPTLCIPMYGDQPSNQRGMEMNGISVFLEYNTINKETFQKKLETVFNPKYKKRALEMQIAFRDRPMSPLNTSIYWIEYVARQKGADFIKLSTRHLYWFQKYLLDIIFLHSFPIITILFVLKKILCKTLSKEPPNENVKKNK